MDSFSFERLHKHLIAPGSRHRDTYLNSSVYYALTGRKGAWVYAHDETIVVTCLHPNRDHCLLVFPEIGEKRDCSLLLRVLATVRIPQNGIQLARFSADDIHLLQQALGKKADSPVESISVMEEPLLDWLYPVHMLDTKAVSSMQGPEFYNVRKEYNKTADRIQSMALSDERSARGLLAVLKYWEGSMILNEKDGIGDITNYYLTLFDLIHRRPDIFDGLIFFEGRKPVGFSIWENSLPGVANFTANLSDISIKGLSDYQLVSSCRRMNETGFGRLNFGGSETEGLDFLKRKFQPAETFPIYSASIQYKNQNDDLSISTLIPSSVRDEEWHGNTAKARERIAA